MGVIINKRLKICVWSGTSTSFWH